GLRLAEEGLGLGADRIRTSPSLGLSAFHGVALILTQHPREGVAELEKVNELAHGSQQLTPLVVSHDNYVFGCEVTGELAPALTHGRDAVDYAERTGNQVSRGFAYLALGIANVLNREWHDALQAIEAARSLGGERRILWTEGGVLGAMAAAHLG